MRLSFRTVEPHRSTLVSTTLATLALAFLPASRFAHANAAPRRPAAARSPAAAEFLRGRIALKLREGAEFDSAQLRLAEPSPALLLPIPTTRVDAVRLARWRTLELPIGLEDAVLALLEQRPEVERADRLGLGFSALNLPLFGGVLVPSPDLVYLFVASAKGAKAQVFSFAAALPAGLVVHAQAAALDAVAPRGIALSNALRVSVP